jgi:molybdopterin-guanine dinucleotide biosynthesis protein A
MKIAGAILAGGGARRFGGDKALALLDGMPLLRRVADRLAPQVDQLLLSGEGRPGFALPVLNDPKQGPLVALLGLLRWARDRDFALLVTAPCDGPFLPLDLTRRLLDMLGDGDCAFAAVGAQDYPTCALWRVAALPKIESAFAMGTSSLKGAIASVPAVRVAFSGQGPDGDPFFNINNQADLEKAEAWLRQS